MLKIHSKNSLILQLNAGDKLHLGDEIHWLITLPICDILNDVVERSIIAGYQLPPPRNKMFIFYWQLHIFKAY